MAQHDYIISNASGSVVRADLNDALSAIVTLNSGAAEPSTMYARMLWADTTNNLLKMRNAANTAWITLGVIGTSLVDYIISTYTVGTLPAAATAGRLARVSDDAGALYMANGTSWGRASPLPPGTVICTATSAAPTGFLLCDGSAVSRTTYADLFAAISVTYGAGDNVTTFNVPNLQGRVAVGYDSGQTEFDALGETGGTKTHTLITAEMPAHTHSTSTGSTLVSSPGSGGNVATTAAGSLWNGSASIASTGGGGAHQNLQPYIVLKYVIKT